MAPGLIWGALGLIVFFMVVMPLLRKVSAAISRPIPIKVQGEDSEDAMAMRKHSQVKSVADLEAEIEAELNAEGASSAGESQRRQLIKRRIQESSYADPETTAQLVRSWIVEDGR